MWDFGDNTVEGCTFRDTVRDAFVFAAVVFVRFFGTGRSSCVG